MSKYGDLYAAFDSAKRNADDYLTDCVLFCNKLATISQQYFQCPSPICFTFFIAVKRPQKEVKLDIKLQLTPQVILPLALLVRKNDDKFMVKIEGTNEEFTIDQIEQRDSQSKDAKSVNESDLQSFIPLLDSAYRWLENLAVTAAWQWPTI